MAQKKETTTHKVMGYAFTIIMLFMIGGKMNSCMHQSSNDNSHPRTHLTAKQKAKRAERKKEKAIAKANEKQHLKDLQRDLATLPSQSKGEIVSAKLDKPDDIAVTISLSDDMISGSDAQTRKFAKEAWEIGTNYAHKDGPYPSGKLDYDEPLVYVTDSAGDELGRTSAFGDFKWEG